VIACRTVPDPQIATHYASPVDGSVRLRWVPWWPKRCEVARTREFKVAGILQGAQLATDIARHLGSRTHAKLACARQVRGRES
jgi:hypothetical protein